MSAGDAPKGAGSGRPMGAGGPVPAGGGGVRPGGAAAARSGGGAARPGGGGVRSGGSRARSGGGARPTPATDPVGGDGAPTRPGSATGLSWRPALARAVVFRRDRVRGLDLLVLPERVVVLRGDAGSILRLVDGERDVRAIVDELSGSHPGAPVADEVPAFLGKLREEGWLS
ncbi:pyrroloquinoline quinone biosynthesis peptide chaperone PqqD [Streptomyces sp. NPDC057638]|uniref:pyrroloquinoline quinone biosynthesis peptide chaperone PqqD n=1 Tax=Streptomyces sp. NPDC057638 TaxID=3346190 RepID=UPI0036C335B5